MKKETAQECPNPRLGRVGGQAVMEGVMMRCGDAYSVAVLQSDGSVTVVNDRTTSVRKKNKLLNLPILRGIINFVETMILSFKTLSVSADAFIGEEEESKFEKWMKEHLGARLLDVVMSIAMVLGVLLGVSLFIWLPDLVLDLIERIGGFEFGLWRALLSGLIKIGIFILYIFLVSRMAYIRRTFEFHGAEHKSIACYEAGMELTPENARNCSRFHPRCGTSFLLIVMVISFFMFLIIPTEVTWMGRVGYRLLLLPVVAGVSYEIIKFAGRHNNVLTRIISAPGLWLQRLTTREPDDSMIEVAIASLTAVMPQDKEEAKW